MSRCRTVRFFYALIPLSPWRDFLIRRHVEGCARCQASLASRTEALALFVREGTMQPERDLWAAIEAELAMESAIPAGTIFRQAPGGLRARQWAVAAALLLVLVTGFWILKDFKPEAVSPAAVSPVRFELAYARVAGQPANVMIYQPQDSDMIIVWAGKNE